MTGRDSDLGLVSSIFRLKHAKAPVAGKGLRDGNCVPRKRRLANPPRAVLTRLH